LVCLQSEGALRPFFCIHPAGGTVFCYRRLAESLGRQRPFYALQAVGVDGVRMPLQSIEEMAVHYAQTIRAAQRHGPYYLGGWSLGGNLAFETARCLTAQGEQVALLALFDSAALQPDRAPDQRAFLPLVMDFFPDEENLPLETLQAMAWHEQLEYFVQRAGQAEIVMAGADFVAGRHVFEVFRANMQAIIAYRQKSYAGRLLLFAAQHDAALFSAAQQQDFGWGRWAEGGVEVHRVEGNHVRLVLDPHVTALAARLNECLAQADCGAPPYVTE
jgi:thioesterase domain-containing protein